MHLLMSTPGSASHGTLSPLMTTVNGASAIVADAMQLKPARASSSPGLRPPSPNRSRADAKSPVSVSVLACAAARLTGPSAVEPVRLAKGRRRGAGRLLLQQPRARMWAVDSSCTAAEYQQVCLCPSTTFRNAVTPRGTNCPSLNNSSIFPNVEVEVSVSRYTNKYYR
eukprot:SAG31_NODE_566_length_14037_cov_32.372148_6_plen_168_part_00